MVNPTYHLLLFYCLILLFFCVDAAAVAGNGIDEVDQSKTMVRVGVILDLNSTFGEMAESCISMAVSDFYSKNPRYRTRLEIHSRDSKEDVVAAASAGEKVLNNWSRFVLIIWFFVVLILTQSYTASLTSMLTVQRLQPLFTDIKDLRRNGYYVGYQNGSFVKQFLVKRLNLDESKLKPYSTSEEYDKALSDGTHNGGVAAIIDEIPYIKVFLNNYCSKYTVVGPTYKTDGFGFVFPLGSPLVPYFSRAILNVTEGDKIEEIERKYFKQEATCKDQSTLEPSNSLSIKSFWGLFQITASASGLSLLAFIIQFVRDYWHDSSPMDSNDSILTRLVTIIKYFDQKDLSSYTFKRSGSRVHPLAGKTVTETSPTNIEPQSPSTISKYPTSHGAIEEETQEEPPPDLGDQTTNMPRSM